MVKERGSEPLKFPFIIAEVPLIIATPESRGLPISAGGRQRRGTEGQKYCRCAAQATVAFLSRTLKRGVKVLGCPGGCLSAVCGLGAWCCCPALLSGLVVWPCRLVLSSGRPKDRSSGRYPQVRTIYLDVGPAIGYLPLLCFFLFLFLCTPSSRIRHTGRGQWKSLHVQSGLSVEVAPFHTVTVGTVYVETVQSSHRLG